MFGNNVTLIELLDDWLENYHRYEVKPQTYFRYRCCAEYIREGSIAEKNIKKISRKDVTDFMAELRSVKSKSTGKPLSVSTMDMTLTVIQMVFSFAEEYGYVKESPCKNVKRPCKPKGYGKDAGKMRCLDLSEQLRLEQYIAQSANTEYYGYILDLYTGLRMGELLALTWDDIDFEKGLLYVNKSVYYQKDENGCWTRMTGSPKSKTSFREIPLPEHVIKDLAYLKERAKGENIVSFADGRPISPRLFRWRYDKILSSLKIRKVNFHGLRHTFATRAIENGVDLKTLSEILGHSNPGITMRIYTHSTTEHKRIAMNSMTRLIDKYR